MKNLHIDHLNEGEVFLDTDPTGEEEEDALTSPAGYPTKDQLDRESQSQDIKERKNFADRAFGITQTWIGFLIVLTIAQFTVGKCKDLGLTETEFNVVFTTTTASVFGFWILVGKYLFNTKK